MPALTASKWFIRDDRDNRILCEDGCFRMHADPATFKYYRYRGTVKARLRALSMTHYRKCMKAGDDAEAFRSPYTAFALYPGDVVDASGKIDTAERQTPSFTEKYDAMHRAAQEHDEKNDCAVKAIAIATNSDYTLIRSMLMQEGRRHRGRSCDPQIYNVLSRLGATIHLVPRRHWPKTVAKAPLFLRRDATYLIHTSRHILCMSGGEVHDWTQGRRHRPTMIHRVTMSTVAGEDQ